MPLEVGEVIGESMKPIENWLHLFSEN